MTKYSKSNLSLASTKGGNKLEDLPEADYREWMIKEAFDDLMGQVWANQIDSSTSWKTFLKLLRAKRNRYAR